MTHKHAIELLKTPIHCTDKGDEAEMREALDMAIKALEQEPTCETCEYESAAFMPCNACKDKSEYVRKKEPCSDAEIQADYDAQKAAGMTDEEWEYGGDAVSRQTGKWIETAEEYYKAINERGGGVNENTPYFVDDIGCSECLSKFSVIDNETERFDYCPKCGADMRGNIDKVNCEKGCENCVNKGYCDYER